MLHRAPELPNLVLLGMAAIFGLSMPVCAQQVDQIRPASASSSAKALKTKIAIGRFSNETRYGQTLLRDDDLDPLGKQASDILSAYLVKTGRFLVFERPDLSKIERERKQNSGSSTVAADTLIVGSIVEFGRTEDGKRGLLNKQRVQKAHAKVAIRLVDVRTGLAYFSATGQGEATTETKTVLGLGSTSRFDGTLTDKALSVAVEDMLEELVNTLAARKWQSDILTVEGGQIYISGGPHQGLAIGDRLSVVKPGKVMKSAQTGFEIQLPASEIATIEVVSLFGDNETNEGAVTRLVAGSLEGLPPSNLMVTSK